MEDLKSIFLKVVKDNYANFEGRARRREYWMFILAYFIIYFAVAIVAAILSSISGTLGSIVYGLLSLGALAVLVPSLAVGVRRLHDIGKSGWFLLVGLIPLVGAIWLIILLATDGTPGENQYGKNPKEIA